MKIISVRAVLILTILLAGASASMAPMAAEAAAQTPPSVSIEAMSKLTFLQGEWRGDGWIRMGPGQPRKFSQTETVQTKLDGLVTMIEGLGRGADTDNKGAIVHDALALVSYDEGSKTYRFHAYTGDGRSVDAEAKLVSGNILQWGFSTPQGARIKYTMDLSQSGKWHEIGEYSADGKSWLKFFEMSLQRAR
ncbi:MAG TPA: hypothetical protein VJX67_10020 [Blastocatellia bacterium]|nr:hypothetical protein [Blastocatellia bacterium]